MIVSRTPFRVSFAGGGTDLEAFYGEEPGAITAMTVDRYMYLIVSRRFDDTLRVSYSETEIVEDFEKLKHPIVRECLRHTGSTRGLEITSIADIPPGTGLGSSSSFTVGLLHALYAFQGHRPTPEKLAREACHIEIDALGSPIGKQDQYVVAYGGLRHILFQPDGTVVVDPVRCSPETLASLEASLMVFYTGTTRSASTLLRALQESAPRKRKHLRAIRDLAGCVRDVLQGAEPLDRIGDYLHEGWLHKQQLAGGITNSEIDSYYQRARDAGALGGRILGAGGGGFLLLFVAPGNQPRVARALNGIRRLPFGFEPHGSQIIFAEER